MSDQKKIAVVTGAASGIGRALAQALDQRGYRLALADLNQQGLDETAKLLREPPLLCALDVSKRDQIFAFAADVHEKLGEVDLVVNNAGVGLIQTIAQLAPADFEWIFGINFWGVVHGTQAFLPRMLAAKRGVIVNISSVFGLVAFPSQGAYVASKFAVRGFTETLRQELRETGVRAVCVHPGGIRTNIVRTSRFQHDLDGLPDRDGAAAFFEKVARTTPAQAAEVILRGVERGKERILIGSDARAIDWLARLLPESYAAVARPIKTWIFRRAMKR